MNTVSKNFQTFNTSFSGLGVYDDVQDIAIEDITSQLEKMIESSETFEGWALSVKDGTRLVKTLNSRRRIIKSSFKFQLKQNFSNFKSVPKTRFDQSLTRDRHSLKLSGVDLAAEYEVLERIISSGEETYGDFYALACQRFQYCVQRTQISEAENPVHVKRLCEAFQYALDALNLDSKFQIAAYRLFANFVIDNLGLTYKKIDLCLIENNILPDLQLDTAKPEVLDPVTKTEEVEMDLPTKQEKHAVRENPDVDKEITPNKKVKSLVIVKPKDQETPKKSDVIPERLLNKNIAKEPLPVENIDHSANFHKGDWVEVIQKNGTKMAKLVWKADDYSLFIFVDNTGNRIRELNSKQLNKEIEDGSINLVATSSIASNKANFSIVQPFMGR